MPSRIRRAEQARLRRSGGRRGREAGRGVSQGCVGRMRKARAWPQVIKRFSLPVIQANGYGVNSATLHPDRKAFVAGGGNFWVYVHDYETGEELQCNKGHHGPVYGVRFTPDGKNYASAGDDGTIRIWKFGEEAAVAEAPAAAPAVDAE